MSYLDKIQRGKQDKPRRTMLYGVHGIGKSTFGAMSNRPIFIPTEDGLDEIDCDKFPKADSYEDMIRALSSLATDEHEYMTAVVDSLDWAEQLIWNKVCEEHNKTNIEEIGYAKGYVFAMNYWREMLAGLEYLRATKGMAVILLAHHRIERFEDPEHEPYDRFCPKLHRHASALVQEWCDDVLFARYKVLTRKSGEGFREKNRGIGSGERVILTTERPSHVAKNRANLPDEMSLDWREYEDHVAGNGKPRGSALQTA